MSKPATRGEGPMVLPRAFALLRLLADAPQGLTLSALAASIDVPKSSLSSTLKALTDQGYLIRRGTLYFLGGEAYALASTLLAGRTIRQIARPYLEQLMVETGETVLLAQLDVDEKHITYIDMVESDKTIRFSVPLAARRPLYCSAAGQVFLAHMGERQRDAYYRDTVFEKMTDATAIDRVDLERLTDQIRRAGLAVSMGGYTVDAAGLAAPVYNSDGSLVAAVVIGVPVARATREVEKYSFALQRLGKDLSKVLGHSEAA